MSKPRMNGIKEFLKSFNTKIHWYGNDSSWGETKARYCVLLHGDAQLVDTCADRLEDFMLERGFDVIATRVSESVVDDHYSHAGRIPGKTWRISVTYKRDVALVDDSWLVRRGH